MNHARPAGVFARKDLSHGNELRAQVVVIGSGAGGAAVAAELAEAGLDVAVVEEGGYYPTKSFTTDISAMIRNLYRDGATTVAMGNPPILYQEGRAVGGSTVINGGMSWRTPERVLERWRDDHGLVGLDSNTMEFYFDRVEKRIHVAEQDPETLGQDNLQFKRGADSLGWDVIGNRRNQLHCAGSNNCAFGCPTGAKQSALVSYLPRALHFGARIYSNLKTVEILRRGKRACGVRCQISLPGFELGGEVVIRADFVVVACGAIHTPTLLLGSGLRPPSHRLGFNLSLHPNVKVVARMKNEVRGWEGVHQGFQVREFDRRGIMAMAAVNVPPGILALTMPEYGDDLGAILDSYSRMLIAGCLLEDHTTGRVRRGPGGYPIVTYDLCDEDAGNAVDSVALLSELLFEAGAETIYLPFRSFPELKSPDEIRKLTPSSIRASDMEVLSVHLMGTAAMGSDRSRAVTDSFGYVYDAEGLMVADASLFPGPVGVNPMETIMALATRNAHHLILERKRRL